jgi:hypothetical protein
VDAIAAHNHFGSGVGKPRLVSLFSHPMGWVYWNPFYLHLMTKHSTAAPRDLSFLIKTNSLIRVVSTNRATGSLRKLLTPCFAGIAKRQNATYICQMFRQMIKSTCLYSCGRQLLRRVDGLPVVRHFKSLSHRHRSSSSA